VCSAQAELVVQRLSARLPRLHASSPTVLFYNINLSLSVLSVAVDLNGKLDIYINPVSINT